MIPMIVSELEQLKPTLVALGAKAKEDCYVCVEEDGVGRVLTGGPEIDTSSGILVELDVAAPVPVAEAKIRFDVNKLGPDLPIDLTGCAFRPT